MWHLEEWTYLDLRDTMIEMRKGSIKCVVYRYGLRQWETVASDKESEVTRQRSNSFEGKM